MEMALENLLVLCFLFLGTAVSLSSGDYCCAKGRENGQNVYRTSNGSCSVIPPGVLTEEENSAVLCEAGFKLCCESILKSSKCKDGMDAISNGNQCPSFNAMQREEKACCECCENGKKEGMRVGANCDQTLKKGDKILSILCSSTFKRCCNSAQVELDSRKLSCTDLTCGNNTSICQETADGAKCRCIPGFQRKDRFNCVDTNECLSNSTNRCPQGTYCLNMVGHYRCLLNCPSPRYEEIQRFICSDVDECWRGTHRCQQDYQECVNVVGGYRCKQIRCQDGLRMIDGSCVDINECEESPGICGKGDCHNNNGGFDCKCEEGYYFDDRSKTCIDVNECVTNRHYCDYRCINTEGSYYCTCPAGFTLVEKRCLDNDECLTNNPCESHEFCFNTYGSYMCIDQSCPDTTYYKSTPSSGEPNSCKKECKKAPKDKEIVCQLGRTPQSVTRVTYGFSGDVKKRGLLYNYAWRFPSTFFIVEPKIISGNKGREFEVEIVTPSKARVVNLKEIAGPRTIKLIMHTDVRTHTIGEPLAYRYVHEFYIYVPKREF